MSINCFIIFSAVLFITSYISAEELLLLPECLHTRADTKQKCVKTRTLTGTLEKQAIEKACEKKKRTEEEKAK